MKDLNNYETAKKIGEEIIEILYLKPINERKEEKEYNTEFGRKTAAGIARTIEIIFQDN